MEYNLTEENYVLGLEAGVKNLKDAAKYFKKSFAAGNVHAMYTYADMIMTKGRTSISTTVFKKGIEAYFLAAEKGHENAKLCLAFALFTGRVVKRDVVAALELFEELVKAENLQAMQHMASLYYDGYFVKKDLNKAFELCNKVVNEEYKSSYEIHLYNHGSYNGDSYEGDNDLFRLNEKYTTYHDENYFPHLLGMMYFNAEGTKQDYKKAFELFCLGTNQLQSIYMIGYMYEKGIHVDQDYKKAITNYRIIEKNDNIYAKTRLNELSNDLDNFVEISKSCDCDIVDIEISRNSFVFLSCYRNGIYVMMRNFADQLTKKGPTEFTAYPYSIEYAYDVFMHLVNLKDTSAMSYLGDLLFWGTKFKRNVKDAINILSLIENSNVNEDNASNASYGLSLLADCYLEGKGVAKDLNEALRLTEVSLKFTPNYSYSVEIKAKIEGLMNS